MPCNFFNVLNDLDFAADVLCLPWHNFGHLHHWMAFARPALWMRDSAVAAVCNPVYIHDNTLMSVVGYCLAVQNK